MLLLKNLLHKIQLAVDSPRLPPMGDRSPSLLRKEGV